MSRKNICILAGAVFAIAIYWLGFVNGVYYAENKTETRTEDGYLVTTVNKLNEHVETQFGSGYYTKITGTGNEYVYYDVYTADGKLVYGVMSRFDLSEDNILYTYNN